MNDFHFRCDGKTNTITIIRNNLNYVFGGYASASWDSSSVWTNYPNAFLFSLRSDGKSYNEKFTIKNHAFALFNNSNYRPTFGCGSDLYICNESNIKTGSFTNFGHSFNVPIGYSYNDGNAKSFLAGNFNEWTTTEIEVYQISLKLIQILSVINNKTFFFKFSKLIKNFHNLIFGHRRLKV